MTLPLKLPPFLDGSDFSDAGIELTFGQGKTALRVFGVYSDSDGAVYGFGYDGPFREPNRYYVRFNS